MADVGQDFGAELILLDGQHPWPSLHAFTEDNQEFFRGRDREVEELVRRIRRDVLTVLFGISGLGKTSLLQAGVFPALSDADFVPILIRLDHEASDVDVVEQIRAAIVRRLEVPPEIARKDFSGGESLWSLFHRRDVSALRRGDKNVRIVLVFDQFEEIFTRWLSSPEAETSRRHFLSELASLVENRPPEELKARLERDASIVSDYDFASENCRVVISLREDYLPHLEELKGRLPSVMENRFRLTPMDQQQALEAILGPGREIIDESVAREVIAFLGAGETNDPGQYQARMEIDPALLSLICSELNAQRILDKVPRITSELLHGRSHRILDEFYLRCFEFLPEAQREPARAFVEDRLLTPGGHRGTVAVETARAELATAGVDVQAIHKLVQSRLLQVDERHRLQRVELAHDVLTKVVTEQRNRRYERNAIESQRKKELAELAEARESAEKADAQIRRLRKARVAYAAIGAVFFLLGLTMALLARNYYATAKNLSETQGDLFEAKKDLEKKNAALVLSSEEAKKSSEAAEQVIEGVTSGLLQEIDVKDGAQIATLQRVINTGLAAFQHIPPSVASSPRLRLNRAKLLRASAEAFIALGLQTHFDDARKSAEGARDLLANAGDDAISQAARCEVYLTLGDIFATRGHDAPEATASPEVEAFFIQADKNYDLALDLVHTAQRTHPGDVSFLIQEGLCLLKQGSVVESRWRRVRAVEGTQIAAKRQLLQAELAKYDAALKIASGLSDPSRQAEIRRLLADIHNKIGTAYALMCYQASPERESFFNTADTHFFTALTLRRELLKDDPGSVFKKRLVAYSTNNIGWLNEIKLNDDFWANKSQKIILAQKVEQFYKERLKLALEVAATDPQNFSYRRDLGGAYTHLAILYQKWPALIAAGRDKSIEYYQEAVAVTQRQSADELENLAKAATVFGRSDLANQARADLEKLKTTPLAPDLKRPKPEDSRD